MYVLEKCKQKSGPPPRKAYRINYLTKENWELKKTQKKKKLLNVALQQNFQSGRSTSIYGGRKAFRPRRQKIHHFSAANRDFAIPLFQYMRERERERERERFEADHPYKLKEQQEASNPNSPRPLPGALSSPGMLAAV